MSVCTQSHEAAFESYADASQSLPFRGSVEIFPKTTERQNALREDEKPERIRNVALDF
jgi:hypothetical protein